MKGVALQMRTTIFRSEQIARPGIMAALAEGAAYNAGKLTCHKHPHGLSYAVLPNCWRNQPRDGT
jgi:hypothetical protein